MLAPNVCARILVNDKRWLLYLYFTKKSPKFSENN